VADVVAARDLAHRLADLITAANRLALSSRVAIPTSHGTASLKWSPCSRAISCTMSTIQASPASEPDVPDEPMINGIPALTARVIMISVSRLTAAAENMQMPVASGPGPGSVLPASQPIIRAPSEIALSSDSAREQNRAPPATDNQHYRGSRPKASDVLPKIAAVICRQ
jgi:hypothetical protein